MAGCHDNDKVDSTSLVNRWLTLTDGFWRVNLWLQWQNDRQL